MNRFARPAHIARRGRVCAVERLESRYLFAADVSWIVDLPTVNLTAHEQLLVEEINRTRADPAATALRLGIDLNAGVSGDQLLSDSAKAPLAVREPLVVAAGLHSQDMLDRDYFSHVSPDPAPISTPPLRALAQGYSSPVGENIAVRSIAVDLTSEVLATHDQLFGSPGHRVNMLRDEFSDLGTGIRRADFVFGNGSELDALMTTEMFGIGGVSAITGVVYDDAVLDDDRYSVGEELAGAVIEAQASDGTIYRVRSGTSGGYTLDVPDGVYAMNVTGGGLTLTIAIPNVRVAGKNVKVDVTPALSTPPDPAGGGGGTTTPSRAELRALDVSGDGEITPRDALLVLNYLLEERVDYDRSLDVTGDGLIAPRDALNVVNYLNRYGNGTFVPNQETLSYFPSSERSTDTAAPLPDGSAAETTGTWLDERRSKRLGDWFPVLSPVEADPAVDAFLASI